MTRRSARRPRTAIAVWLVGTLAAIAVMGKLLSGSLTTEAQFVNDPEAKRRRAIDRGPPARPRGTP